MHLQKFSCHYFPKYNLSLMKYFSRDKTNDGLPDPFGPLNEAVPFSIEEASRQGSECSAKLASVVDSGKKCRATYVIATPEQKTKIGKSAAEPEWYNKSNTSFREGHAGHVKSERVEDHLLT